MTELERYKEAVRVAIKRLSAIAESKDPERDSLPDYAREGLRYVNAILNPPPVYEEVTVERWVCNVCDKSGRSTAYKSEPKICSYSSEDYNCNGKEFTKLTGPRRVQVAQKVERSVSVEVWIDGVGGITTSDPFCQHPETFSKHGVLTFTPDE